MMKSIRLAVALLAVAASTAAAAQTTTTGSSSYVQVRAGLYMPQSDDMDALEMNTGFGLDAVYGRRFTPNFAAEFGIGWYKSTSDEMSDGFGNTAEFELSLMPITASAKLIAPLGQVEPYALLGVGLYRATIGIDGAGDDSAFALGLQLGGGAAFRISPNAYLGLDLRYVSAEPSFEEGGEELDLDVSGLLFNAAFGFNF
jgi:opacity protein-like surface antigen